jgi:hypothetical protein
VGAIGAIGVVSVVGAGVGRIAAIRDQGVTPGAAKQMTRQIHSL